MTSSIEVKEAQREIRELKKYLKALAVEVTNQAAALDVIMQQPESVNRGKEVARVANAMNMAADSAMHFGLRMEFKAINKIKNAAKKERPFHPVMDLSSRFGYARQK